MWGERGIRIIPSSAVRMWVNKYFYIELYVHILFGDRFDALPKPRMWSTKGNGQIRSALLVYRNLFAKQKKSLLFSANPRPVLSHRRLQFYNETDCLDTQNKISSNILFILSFPFSFHQIQNNTKSTICPNRRRASRSCLIELIKLNVLTSASNRIRLPHLVLCVEKN